MILQTSIILIVIIIIIQIYFIYNKESIKNINIIKEDMTENTINFIQPNPWTKIVTKKDNKKLYSANIKKFNENLFVEWRNIIENLDYDVTTKEIIIESRDEPRALAILNLIISNMKGDITISEIFENDLMNKSILKARKHKVVAKKLLDLIKENNTTNNGIVNKNKSTETTTTDEEYKHDTVEDIKKNTYNEIKPEDYNYDGFENKHNNLFGEDKLIINTNIARPYGGKQFASPFRY